MKNQALIEKLNNLTAPIVKSNGFDLYYLEYVKEGGQNIFRVYIDSENGIGLDDCVKVSRAVSDMLDAEDPIVDEYNLEVSSPGVFRTLYTEEHLNKYNDNDVLVVMKSLINGKKKFEGILKGFNEENLILLVGNEEMEFPRAKISSVSLNPSL